MAQKIFQRVGVRNIFWPLVGGSGACFLRKFWKLVSWDWLKMHFQHFRHNQFVVKMLRSSSNRGNWCCLTRKFFGIYSLPGDFGDVLWGWKNLLHIGSLPAKREDLAGLFVLKLLGWIYSFFLHFFATWESLFWRFLMKVRSCGHFLVSAKPVIPGGGGHSHVGSY